MANQPTDNAKSYDYPASTVTRANGGFDKDDKEVIGRWVQQQADGSVLLVGEDQRPTGVIQTLDATKVGVAMGPWLTGKQSGTTKIPIDSWVTGDTKVVVPGGSPERGFVKEVDATSGALQGTSIGFVTASEDTTANSEGKATTEIYRTR